MTGIYERQGIHFQYPENWELTDDDLSSLPRTISVQSPTGAFWSVDIHPYSVDPVDLCQQVLAAMREEYEGLEASQADSTIAGEPAEAWDLYFLCLDFVVTARLRCLRSGHATYLLTYQAEDRDFDQLSGVFDAITHTFFSSIQQA